MGNYKFIIKMKKSNILGITEGEWSSKGIDETRIWVTHKNGLKSCLAHCNNQHMSSYNGYIDLDFNELKSNAKLIADAGTTANKCGKLPSELLKERDQLIEVVKTTCKYLPTPLCEDFNKLIQSIEQ